MRFRTILNSPLRSGSIRFSRRVTQKVARELHFVFNQ